MAELQITMEREIRIRTFMQRLENQSKKEIIHTAGELLGNYLIAEETSRDLIEYLVGLTEQIQNIRKINK